jgi:hypothetical protein
MGGGDAGLWLEAVSDAGREDCSTTGRLRTVEEGMGSMSGLRASFNRVGCPT